MFSEYDMHAPPHVTMTLTYRGRLLPPQILPNRHGVFRCHGAEIARDDVQPAGAVDVADGAGHVITIHARQHVALELTRRDLFEQDYRGRVALFAIGEL